MFEYGPLGYSRVLNQAVHAGGSKAESAELFQCPVEDAVPYGGFEFLNLGNVVSVSTEGLSGGFTCLP